MELYQKRMKPDDFIGLDTVQGHLHLAKVYENGKYMKLAASQLDEGRGIPVLSRLQEEGYLEMELSPSEDGIVTLEKISLTISGYQLLEELNEKSLPNKIKNRIVNAVWSIVTAFITTLMVLWLKS